VSMMPRCGSWGYVGARKLAELLRLTCLGLAGQHLYTLRWRNYRSCLVFWLGWLETAVAYLRRWPAQAFSACQRGKRHVSADSVAAGRGPGCPCGRW